MCRGTAKKKKNSPEHISAAVAHLLKTIGIRATFYNVRQTLESHPDFPSLLSIAESLPEWSVDTEAVKGTFNELLKEEFPGIAHLKNNTFVVIEELNGERVTFFDAGEGNITCTPGFFAEVWSGVFLRVKAVEKAEEENFRKNKRMEIQEILQKFSIIVGLPLLAIIAFLFGYARIPGIGAVSLIFGIKLLGFFLCLSVVFKDSLNIPLLDHLCTNGEKNNCQKVLKSPASRVFGFPMADIGIIYFLGGLSALLFMVYIGEPMALLFLMTLINLSALPYTVFSIYYQAFVVRSWCWTCVSIQILLWIEFYFLKSFLLKENVRYLIPAIVPFLLAFVLTAFFWSALKRMITLESQTQKLQLELNRCKRNPLFIQAQLAGAQKIDIENFPQEVEIGSKNARFVLTQVMNPLCGNCWDSFRQMKKLVRIGNGHIKSRLRFLIGNVENGASSPGQTLAHDLAVFLIAKVLAEKQEELSRCFSELEGIETLADVKSLTRKWDKFASKEQELVENARNILKSHSDWAIRNSIKATPKVFLNGIMLPNELQIEDLKIFLVRQIES